MLRMSDPQLLVWDGVLPQELCRVPSDLVVADEVLRDEELFEGIVEHWHRSGRDVGRGRPSIAIDTYVRLMVCKHYLGLGYERLMRTVSDSIHLRRFCLIGLTEKVPDESTVRKLTRELGPGVVESIIDGVIRKAVREEGFSPRAVRVDSTVVEGDVRYPTDIDLAASGVRALARVGRRATGLLTKGKARREEKRVRVVDRSRTAKKKVRAVGRTLKARSGKAKEKVLELAAQTGRLLAKSVREAEKVIGVLRASARGRGALVKLRTARQLEVLAARSRKIVEQIKARRQGKRISDRLVSLFDPDVRPIRKGKLGNPTQFGYVHQIAELSPNTTSRTKGFILPTQTSIGNPTEDTLLTQTTQKLKALGIRPREVALDGGFTTKTTHQTLKPLEPKRVFISGRDHPTSKHTYKRLRNYRAGIEGRISHLKRNYQLKRSRLKGHTGAKIWCGWAILTYNLQTYTHHTKT